MEWTVYGLSSKPYLRGRGETGLGSTSGALISMTPHRMASDEFQELKVQLHDLLDRGFIRPSTTPWGTPILFAKKTDKTIPLCIDYR